MNASVTERGRAFDAARGWRSLCLACSMLLVPCSAVLARQSAPIVECTPHYSIEMEGEGSALAAEAAELGVVLEQASKSFGDVLHADAVDAKAGPCSLHIRANRESWLAAMDAAGVVPPSGLDSLYFQPERNALFLYRQPTRWLTRRLALHGAWQQAHYRAKSKHADMVNTWFVLGLAEQLSNHRWNGKTLELAAHPRISITDLPGQALKALQGGLGMGVFSEDNLGRPELSWALVSFLREGNGGKYRARFDKLALGQTGSKLTGPEFAGTLGKLDQIYSEYETWLASVQEPLGAVCGDWEDIDGRVFVGRAIQDDFAFAVVRASAQRIEARFVLEPGSAAGLLLGFKDKHHYTFAVLDQSDVVVKLCDGSTLSTLGEYQGMPTKDGSHRMRAERAGERVTLFVEDRETGTFVVEGQQLGFAIDKGAARFLDVSWK